MLGKHVLICSGIVKDLVLLTVFLETYFFIVISTMQRKKVEDQPEKMSGMQNKIKQKETTSEWRKRIFGFDWSEIKNWESFVKLLHSPRDPANLAVARVLLGIMMLLDIPQERGLAHVDHRWGQPYQCRFPLFNFLEPLPLPWMTMTYLCMLIGVLGVTLGLFYRLAAVMFVVPYWYIFWLDKTSWNNHSYLYGLSFTMLIFMDANRYWSLDGLWNKKVRNAHIPLWNIALLRLQFFFVYFIAGLKKTELDWITGHSMNRLSGNWVFEPFRLLLTDEQIDFYMVHICGFLLDLTIGFFLFFDVTRPFAMFFGAQFHLMNSMMFSIGMFPWTMLLTMPIFCYCDWPRPIFRKITGLLPKLKLVMPLDEPAQSSDHCIYSKQEVKPEDVKNGEKTKAAPHGSNVKRSKPGTYHNWAVRLVLCYVAIQVFLPYSHFITKGYNNWTNGLYGYSWDMMIHSWMSQHIRITYTKKDTGETGYLNPKAFTESHRWASHGDMMKQFATCIEYQLATYHNISNIELRFDVWKSLNHRFQQRKFDPRVNILEAEWHPLKATKFLLPLLVDLSDWRGKLTEIQKSLHEQSNDTDVVFVADFPGLFLENYVQPDFSNTSITVMSGQIMVEIIEGDNHTLNPGEKLQLPPGKFHNVHTISDSPSCYMYLYVNTTAVEFHKNVTKIEEKLELENKTVDSLEVEGNPEMQKYKEYLKKKQVYNKVSSQSLVTRVWNSLKKWANRKRKIAKRCWTLSSIAVKNVFFGEPYDILYQEFYLEEMEGAEAEKKAQQKAENDDFY